MTAPTGKDLGLSLNEFAFYFQSEGGIDAADLGAFLQRAAVVAGRRGVEIRVLAIEPGSVLVRMKAWAKKTGEKIAKEWNKQPIATTAGAVTLGAIAVQAITTAMGSAAPNPVQKAGADVIIDNHVETINVITPHKVIPLMDREKAQRVRERARHAGSDVEEISDVRRIARGLDEGLLSGSFTLADGDPYFRPDGYQYLVPAKFIKGADFQHALQGGRFMIRGHLETHKGLPDYIVIYDMSQP